MQVAFRVDASLNMGAGHVMRSLTLADELRANNHSSMFICRPLDGNLMSFIEKKGYTVVPLKYVFDGNGKKVTDHVRSQWLETTWQQDCNETAGVLKAVGYVDWLVVDHYGLDYKWQRSLRKYVVNILVIDDLANRQHDSDLLLDQTLGTGRHDYTNLLSKRCRCLFGTEYALLRPQFCGWRQQALARRNDFSPESPHIFVSMGGMDSGNLTGVVLSVLERLTCLKLSQVDIVMGPNAPHIATIKKEAESSNMNVSIMSDVHDIAKLMCQADIAFGTGGTTSWERCCLALPTILTVDADNQRKIAQQLQQKKVAITLFPSTNLEEELMSATKAILVPETYKVMSKCASEVCDGRGVERVVQEMQI